MCGRRVGPNGRHGLLYQMSQAWYRHLLLLPPRLRHPLLLMVIQRDEQPPLLRVQCGSRVVPRDR
jgi:hypothetical protein